jgi:hypothetical protein
MGDQDLGGGMAETASNGDTPDPNWEELVTGGLGGGGAEDPSPDGDAPLAIDPDEDIKRNRSPVPGLESYLGRGYDVLKGYACADAVRRRIFDLEQDRWVLQQTVDKSIALDPDQISHAFSNVPPETKLLFRRPKKVGYTDLFKASTHVSDISTDTSKSTDWGIGGDISGSYMGFSADIQARFDEKLSRLATSRVVTATAEIVYWKLDLYGDYALAEQPPITSGARSDFETRNAETLLDAYGSHCVMSFGMGSRIRHHYMADISKLKQGMDLKASLKASYEGEGATGSLKIDGYLKTLMASDSTAIQVEVEAEGISDIQLAEIGKEQGDAEHPLAILKQGWHNPTLIAMYDNSLTPLWDIEGLMSEAKADEFKAAFESRAQKHRDQIGARFAGLQPLYLFATGEGAARHFRFSTSADHLGAAGEWTFVPGRDAEGGTGKPWLLISASLKDNMVPLFEYVLDGTATAYRYETENWMAEINRRTPESVHTWKKTTSQPLGYVHEAQRGVAPPAGVHPVYAYYDSGNDPKKGVFYSAMKDLVWDNDTWRAGDERLLFLRDMKAKAQADIDREWDSQDWIYQLFHTKPEVQALGFAVLSEEDGWWFSAGLPHWFAADAVVLK